MPTVAKGGGLQLGQGRRILGACFIRSFSTRHFCKDFKGGTIMVGLILIVMGLICVALLLGPGFGARQAPPKRQEGQRPAPFEAESAVQAPAPVVLRGPAWVVDGDTIVIAKTQVRLFGVDAPEMNHPWGIRAKRHMMRLCKGQVITAEVTATDAHGRTVAKCRLPDGRDLSAEMVTAGLAIDWARYSGGIYRAMEVPEARRRMWLADARQKGQSHVWERFERQQAARKAARAGQGEAPGEAPCAAEGGPEAG